METAHKFQKKGYSAIIPFVYEGKDMIHKHMQYEVSMTVCMGRIANQGNIPKWLPFEIYILESLNIWCAFYEGHRCTCVPNMKLLCLIPWLWKVYTDNDTNTRNHNNAGWTKHDRYKALWLINQISQKVYNVCILCAVIREYSNLICFLRTQDLPDAWLVICLPVEQKCQIRLQLWKSSM